MNTMPVECFDSSQTSAKCLPSFANVVQGLRWASPWGIAMPYVHSNDWPKALHIPKSLNTNVEIFACHSQTYHAETPMVAQAQQILEYGLVM
jgi:hypothetical protein